MATYYIEAYKDVALPNKDTPAGVLLSRVTSFYAVNATAAGDIFVFNTLPKGAQLAGMWLQYTNPGLTSAAGQLKVGETTLPATPSLTSGVRNAFFPGMNTVVTTDTSLQIELLGAGFPANTAFTFITLYSMLTG